jgi:hypothetical protein
MGILTKIRQRPDNEKRIFSFVTAGVLTIIIFVVWLSFSNSASNTQTENPDKLSSISPLQVIKDEFSKAFSSSKESTTTHSTSSGQATSTVEIIEK